MQESGLKAVSEDAHHDALRVAIVVNSYPPRLGGLESHVFQLASELVKAGAHVLVVCLSTSASDTVEQGVRVVRLRMHFPIESIISFPALGTTRRLSRLLTEERISVVSTHTRFFPMSWVGVDAAVRSRIPIIHTEHGAGFVRVRSASIQFFARLVDLTLGRRALRRADRVLAVSAQSAQFVTRLSGVDSTVFPNALQLEFWPPTQKTQPPNGIAFLGRLVGGKGWETVIDVAVELITKRGFDDLVVHVLGDGPESELLRLYVQASGIASSVQIHGHAHVATIRSALERSVLVNPSELAEGFQVTLLEAVASGAQVVSYPVPSIAPLLADGGPMRQVEVDSFDALVECVADALRNPLPPMPRGTLESRWSWRVRSHEYLDIAQSVIAARAARNGRGARSV
ncbi:glycosyltransferase family 4 protein [Cryobacterium sp. 5I3]|uniref:glycosyltransferase family 4 protein n=2 Tax=unclassified Cryobacterium TaxID=2649013 RepID=UPI002B22374F|nr:glycosyltransferase family 4 protein [Cryobacterium sp. 5I3]MEB0201769.1 glycosyltransferase family 4 protein [Cryobacterium sp. 5I3]